MLLECSFRDLGQACTYPVPISDWERIDRILSQGRQSFLGLETLDGREVFINLTHMQACRVLATKQHLGPPNPEPELSYYMLGSGLMKMVDVDLEWLPNATMTIESFDELDDRFTAIPDEFGITTFINLDDLIYLEFPSAWMDEALEEEGEI